VDNLLRAEFFREIKFDDFGLVTAIAQDASNRDILMIAYMNREALELTLSEGYMTYWSRSRKKLWKKGETSGNRQKVVSLEVDCDGDALIFRVESPGPACHTGTRSCFFRKWTSQGWERILSPEQSPLDMYGSQPH
jgi:phosphoribosyl-AMP cyclohydrolase